MAAQPSPAEEEWAARTSYGPKRNRSRTRPHGHLTREIDGEDLLHNQQQLQEVVDGLAEEDLARLRDLKIEYVRALVAWEVHKGRQVRRLDDSGVRHSEDLRLAYALAYDDAETGIPGRDLYAAYMAAKTELDIFPIEMKAKTTIASGSQTLLNHGARVTGLTN